MQYNSFGFLFFALWGIFVTIFWMVCGWRAMNANKKVSDALKIISIYFSVSEDS